MKSFNGSRTRDRSLWSLLLLGLLTIAAVIGIDSFSNYRSIEATERDRLMHQVKVVSASMSQRLQTTSNALDAIRQELHGHQEPARDLLNQRLRAMVAAQTGVRSLILMDVNGNSLASNRPELIGMNFRNSERFKTISQGADSEMLYLSAPYVTPLGNYAISVGKMMVDEQGKFNGYVLAVLDPAYFGSLLGSMLYAPDVNAAIVHGDGKVVFRVPDTAQPSGKDLGELSQSLFSQFVSHGQQQGIVSGLSATSGQYRVTAFGFIRPSTVRVDKPLVVTVSRDVAAIFTPWRKQLELHGALFGAVVIFAIVGMFLYQRRGRAYLGLEYAQEQERRAMETHILRLNAELETKVAQRTTELAQANAELRHLSRSDALTGLNNRLAANERLDAEFKRMKRSGAVYAALMLDIDFFKRINDSFGHDTGDQVLKRVARALSGALRETDFAARFGGEEFLVLLPETTLDDARLVAEKIRQAVEESPNPRAGTVTISIGLAMASPENKDEYEAVKQADEHLYRAKEAGRNRVVDPETGR